MIAVRKEARLDARDVAKMKALHATGELSYATLAKRFGVSKDRVKAAMKGEVNTLKRAVLLMFLICLASPVFAQRVTANLSTHGAACGSPPAASTGYTFVPVNTNNGGATFTLGGTWSGVVSFFASGDGATTWVALSVTPSNSATSVTTATGNGTWQANVSGYTHVCAAFTTATSGVAVTTIQLSQVAARGGSGSGGGGGISGSLAGNNAVIVDPSANTVAESAFDYTNIAMQFPTIKAMAIDPTTSGSATIFMGYDPDFEGASVGVIDNTLPGSFCGAATVGGQGILCQDGTGNNAQLRPDILSLQVPLGSTLLFSTSAGNLALGSNSAGIGGSITLNDASSGSDTITVSGSTLNLGNTAQLGVAGTNDGTLTLSSVGNASGLTVLTPGAATSTVNVTFPIASGTLCADGNTCTSPTFVTPALGTPSAVVLTNATGLPGFVKPVASTSAVTSSNPTINTDQALIQLSLPAGYLNILAQPFSIYGSGIYSSTTASSPALTIKAKLCTVSGCGSGTVVALYNIVTGVLNTTALSNATWNLNGTCITTATGATGNLGCHGAPGLTLDTGALVSSPDTVYADTNTATLANIDLTAALFLQFTIAQSVVGTSNAYTQQLAAIR